jgi:PhoPQ-activated pathogenicity-related protein
MRKAFKKHIALLIGTCISIVILIFIARVYCCNPPYSRFLEIDTKWLIVAGVPILIGLFIGGYIKTFKFMDIELELKELVPNSWITKEGAQTIKVIDTDTAIKENTESINSLSYEVKNNINGLKLFLGKKDYYTEEALNEYFRQLPNIKYLQIVTNENHFICLIPINCYNFRILSQNINDQSFENLIKAIETSSIKNYFTNAIYEFVSNTDNRMEVYDKLTRSSESKLLYPMAEVLPVLNYNREMIGLINKATISDEILTKIM